MAFAKVFLGLFMTKRLPFLLFVFGIVFCIFGFGFAVGKYQIFPYSSLNSSIKTGEVFFKKSFAKDIGLFEKFVSIHPNQVHSKRVEIYEGPNLEESLLVFGGRFQFLELCPQNGCLAVVYNQKGQVKHAYPYQIESIYSAQIKETSRTYETVNFNFAKDAYPIGIQEYQNGDLLVTFQNQNTFPFGGGVARVDKKGKALWFRWDYSHHWPTLIQKDLALVPNAQVASQNLEFYIKDRKIRLKCKTKRPYHDQINVLDGQGKLIRALDLVKPLLESSFMAVLQHTSDPCDPLHLNYVDVLPQDFLPITYHSNKIAAGDWIVSLRNLSAFAIIDPKTGEFKAVYKGSFYQQHSVTYWKENLVLLFDNHGAQKESGPSRVISYDLQSHQEKTLFPNEQTPQKFKQLFSDTAGKITLSKDRKRVLISFSKAGRMLEVRLSDGKVLNSFFSIHDNTQVNDLPKERHQKAALYPILGVNYLRSSQ